MVLKLQATDREFVKEACCLRAFKQTRSKRRMHVQRCMDDSFGDVFMKHDVLTSVSSVSSVVEISVKQTQCPSRRT